MKVFCVYLGSSHMKAFTTSLEAEILSFNLRCWLSQHDMDTSIVSVKEEVMS